MIHGQHSHLWPAAIVYRPDYQGHERPQFLLPGTVPWPLIPGSANAEKQPIFIVLRPLPSLFEPLPQKHCSIPNNLLRYFDQFPAANVPNSHPLVG
jgi:hypothetical protein